MDWVNQQETRVPTPVIVNFMTLDESLKTIWPLPFPHNGKRLAVSSKGPSVLRFWLLDSHISGVSQSEGSTRLELCSRNSGFLPRDSITLQFGRCERLIKCFPNTSLFPTNFRFVPQPCPTYIFTYEVFFFELTH